MLRRSRENCLATSHPVCVYSSHVAPERVHTHSVMKICVYIYTRTDRGVHSRGRIDSRRTNIYQSSRAERAELRAV